MLVVLKDTLHHLGADGIGVDQDAYLPPIKALVQFEQIIGQDIIDTHSRLF